MKIACIIHSLNGGGAERVMAALSTRLSQRGHEVVLITLDDGSNDRHSLAASVHRIPLDVMRESRSLWQKWTNQRARSKAIRCAIEKAKPDVVLSFCDRTNITVLSALRDSDIPIVISERSDPHQQNLGWLWETLRRKSYPKATQIVALTDTSAAHLQPLADRSVIVIPSAVDAPPSTSQRVVAQQNRKLLGIGRLEHEKGFDRLIEAFGNIASDYPDWKLTILGEGSQRRDLTDQAGELGLIDRIQMPGWVRPVWDDLCAATAFVLPSRYEGFPSALLESMAAGVPVLAVDCESGPRAIIRHQTDGLLVRNDVESLEQGMRRMIQDTELREAMAEQGKSVVTRFGWDAMVDAYEQTLQSAILQSTTG